MVQYLERDAWNRATWKALDNTGRHKKDTERRIKRQGQPWSQSGRH